MANVAGQGSSRGSNTAASSTVSVSDPAREVVEVHGERERAVVVEPRREVVEVLENGGGTLFVGEPVATYAGTAPIDTTGAQAGQVLMADANGVLRPAPWRGHVTWWVDSTDDVPDAARAGDMVALLDGSGRIFEVVT